jgi:dienelactone hydrolase
MIFGPEREDGSMVHEKGREKLYSLLGDLPDRNLPISVKKVAEDDYGSFTLETLTLELNGFEPVPAYFTRPKNATPPYRAVLFSHSHGGFYDMGKNELLRPAVYGYKQPYSEALAERGIACLAIDHWCFGERSGRKESVTFKSMLWKGQVMWGMMVYDSLRAMDYLCSRDDVDKICIGAIGMSMGCTMTLWTSALDPRIKMCVDLCCLTDFEELEKERGLDYHGIFYYVPSLTKYFSMADINALISPRPHLSTAGLYDELTPVLGLEKIEKALKPLGGFTLNTYPCGHIETREMREDVLAFIQKEL